MRYAIRWRDENGRALAPPAEGEIWETPPRVGDYITLVTDGAPIVKVVSVHWDAPERRDFVTVRVRAV